MSHRPRSDQGSPCPTEAPFDPKCVHATPQNGEGEHQSPKKVFQESVFAHRDDVAERKRKSEVIASHGELLRRYRWHLFLSMDGPPDEDLTPERARGMAHRWVQLAGGEVYAYAVYERGDKSHRGHLHLLVGGKMNGGTIHDVDTAAGKLGVWRYNQLDFPITGWNWGYGNTEVVVRHVALYDPRRGAAEYVSKKVLANPEYGELLGCPPRRHRRRKRGR